MVSIINFESSNGKHKGILSIYLLHSLKKKPKSGYDLLAEIKQKTEGTWTPSKGSIYPLLKQLEKAELIKVKKREQRSKNIFEITSKGKKTIIQAKKQGKQMMEKANQFRNLIIDIIEEDAEIMSTMINIQEKVFILSRLKKEQVIKILNTCLSNLKKEEQ
jgi:DNA-binding PadR family transcriptional regulator